MKQNTHIPSIGDLALKYGTISVEQHTHLLQLFTFKNKQSDIESLMLDQGMATRYQIELLKLIQEYYIVRRSGEEFGKIAIEKGLATTADINQALDLQKKEFKKSRNKKRIGDILVASSIITQKQKEQILKEQNLFSFESKSRGGADHDSGKAPANGEQPEIQILVSTDHMTAWVDRGHPDKTSTSLNQVKDAVTRYGIINGIYPDSFIQCFLDSSVQKFPVARVDCSNLLKRQNGFILNIADANGKPIEKKKGEMLIEHTQTASQVQVQNLYAEKINAVTDNDFFVRCGINTRWSRDKLKIHAVKSGFASLSAARRVFIHPAVNILEDADIRYGPIEAYANLSVSGTITGAFPVTAGRVDAREIRDADIIAIGDIHVRVGISGATIRAQGNIHARYIHNCRIETFGNVYIQNEIIDSHIRCSGKLDSPKCRVITSKIYAKGGVVLAGVGSDRSIAATIIAGSEHHVIGLVKTIIGQMNAILTKLEELKIEKQNQQSQAEKMFTKMIDLKTFHDKAKKKKVMLVAELNKKKEDLDQKTLGNIRKLISTYDKRMNGSIATLKSMNLSKKDIESKVDALEEKICAASAQAEKDILDYEQTLFAYLEKSKERMGSAVIEISGKAHAGTIMGSINEVLSLSDDKNNFKLKEVELQDQTKQLQFASLHQTK